MEKKIEVKKDRRKICDIGSSGMGSCADGKKLDTYVDGRIRGQASRWANMCEECWKAFGIGVFGTGFAQKFEWDEAANAYRKVKG